MAVLSEVEKLRIVAAVTKGETRAEVARQHGVSRQTVYSVLERAKQGGLDGPFPPLPKEAEEWPRVSNILDDIMGGIPQTEVVMRAAERGTKVHEYIEAALLGLEPDVEPELRGYVDAAVAKIKELQAIGQFKVASELPVFDPINAVRGTADVVLWKVDGQTVRAQILDTKTGAPSKRHRLQMAAYMNCLREMVYGVGLIPVVTGALLYVTSDGHGKLSPSIQPQEVEIWKAALLVRSWLVS